MMSQDGTNIAVNTAQGANGAHRRKRSETAARKRDGMQLESFGFDRLGAIDYARCNVHFIARVAGRTSHWQPMRQEVPILRNDIEEARGACEAHLAAQRLCHA